MDHVAWDDQMSVGVDVLDDDHKKLIGMLNGLLRTDVTTKNRDDLAALVADLREYTHVHFSREEALMERCGYPDRDEHRQTHRYFVDEVESLYRDFDPNTETGDTVMLRIDLILLLKDWLLEHIQTVDMRYKPFMTADEATAAES